MSASILHISDPDRERRAAVAAQVRARFAEPELSNTVVTEFAMNLGVRETQVRFLRDALQRFGQHAPHCRKQSATLGVLCNCGLDRDLQIGNDLAAFGGR